jgi:hypothetical protein
MHRPGVIGHHQIGPANLLWAEPTGYGSTMTGFPSVSKTVSPLSFFFSTE